MCEKTDPAKPKTSCSDNCPDHPDSVTEAKCRWLNASRVHLDRQKARDTLLKAAYFALGAALSIAASTAPEDMNDGYFVAFVVAGVAGLGLLIGGFSRNTSKTELALRKAKFELEEEVSQRDANRP